MASPLSYSERRAAGVLARQHCSRTTLKHLQPRHCPQDPLDLLARSMHDRLPHLVPLKYQRMAASAFSFFRGAACIMAADLAAHPHTGIFTQLCGDAHVANLGAYAAQDGSLVFDLNDFDETIQGPFEWDVKRFATSLLLAGRDAGLDREARQSAVAAFTAKYQDSMQMFAAMPVVELARFQIHRLAHIGAVAQVFQQAQRSTPQRLLQKLTLPPRRLDGRRCFRTDLPVQQPLNPQESAPVLASLRRYGQTLAPERFHFFSQYQPVQVALRVVGTGSVGLRCYVVHLESASRKPGTDPLFLQVKQEPASTYAAYLPTSHTDAVHQGTRVVQGQRTMQLVSDPFLGYTEIDGRDFLVRQFNDHKASLDLTSMDAATLNAYASLCGETLARGHARGGDPTAIAAYIGSNGQFARSITAFAQAYSRKSRQDWRALKHAIQADPQRFGIVSSPTFAREPKANGSR